MAIPEATFARVVQKRDETAAACVRVETSTNELQSAIAAFVDAFAGVPPSPDAYLQAVCGELLKHNREVLSQSAYAAGGPAGGGYSPVSPSAGPSPGSAHPSTPRSWVAETPRSGMGGGASTPRAASGTPKRKGLGGLFVEWADDFIDEMAGVPIMRDPQPGDVILPLVRDPHCVQTPLPYFQTILSHSLAKSVGASVSVVDMYGVEMIQYSVDSRHLLPCAYHVIDMRRLPADVSPTACFTPAVFMQTARDIHPVPLHILIVREEAAGQEAMVGQALSAFRPLLGGMSPNVYVLQSKVCTSLTMVSATVLPQTKANKAQFAAISAYVKERLAVLARSSAGGPGPAPQPGAPYGGGTYAGSAPTGFPGGPPPGSGFGAPPPPPRMGGYPGQAPTGFGGYPGGGPPPPPMGTQQFVPGASMGPGAAPAWAADAPPPPPSAGVSDGMRVAPC